jgi:DNA-binding NarL/FixJ family response regulator
MYFPTLEERLLEGEFHVIAKVSNGQQLFNEAMRLEPDVIITDISMPLLNGIEAIDRLKESGCRARVVFVTVHSDPDFMRRSLSTGALGYVVKSRVATELILAVRNALDGRIFVSQ